MRVRYNQIIIVGLIAASVILAYDALTSYINPYIPIQEITRNGATYLHSKVQVLGTVANGTVNWTENSSIIFNLTDGQYDVGVMFVGPLPQNFQEGQQVVVIGELVSPRLISASEMLVKCPSKYEGGKASPLDDPIFLVALILAVAALVYYVAFVLFKGR